MASRLLRGRVEINTYRCALAALLACIVFALIGKLAELVVTPTRLGVLEWFGVGIEGIALAICVLSSVRAACIVLVAFGLISIAWHGLLPDSHCSCLGVFERLGQGAAATIAATQGLLACYLLWRENAYRRASP